MKTPRWITHSILLAFLFNTLGPIPTVQAQEFKLPAPGVIVHLSPSLEPPLLKGIKVHANNPFRFDFILDKGDSGLSVETPLMASLLKQEAAKLIKYFLASLTIPEKDLWVNLSPYEKNRIIPQSFGLTEMGRDLLGEDYMLKQITASLIYPEEKIGKKFWKRIYEEAAKRYGTTNIPVNTFNKVWIIPQKAVVYENTKAQTAYIVESKLKVMLEQDYLSLQKHSKGVISDDSPPPILPPQGGGINALGSQVVREVVIPELTKEVNEGKNFARLRQVYDSLILATWYKMKIRNSILSQVYADRNKVAGVNIDDPQEKEKIYQRYLQAFKKGVYNYIKEDLDPATQEMIPRKYFSGGTDLDLTKGAFGILKDGPVPVQSRADQDRSDEVTIDMAMFSGIKQGSSGQAQSAATKLLLSTVDMFRSQERGFQFFGVRENPRILAKKVEYKDDVATIEVRRILKSVISKIKTLSAANPELALSGIQKEELDNFDIIASRKLRTSSIMTLDLLNEDPPLILINADLVEVLNEAELRYVLAHEVAHELLKDVISKLIKGNYTEKENIKIRALLEDRCDALGVLIEQEMSENRDIHDSVTAMEKVNQWVASKNDHIDRIIETIYNLFGRQTGDEKQYRTPANRLEFLEELSRENKDQLILRFNNQNCPGVYFGSPTREMLKLNDQQFKEKINEVFRDSRFPDARIKSIVSENRNGLNVHNLIFENGAELGIVGLPPKTVKLEDGSTQVVQSVQVIFSVGQILITGKSKSAWEILRRPDNSIGYVTYSGLPNVKKIHEGGYLNDEFRRFLPQLSPQMEWQGRDHAMLLPVSIRSTSAKMQTWANRLKRVIDQVAHRVRNGETILVPGTGYPALMPVELTDRIHQEGKDANVIGMDINIPAYVVEFGYMPGGFNSYPTAIFNKQGELVALNGVPHSFTGDQMRNAKAGSLGQKLYQEIMPLRDQLLNTPGVPDTQGNRLVMAPLSQGEYQRPGLTYLQGDILHNPLPDSSVDRIMDFNTTTLYLEGQRAEALENYRRILRPGGELMLGTSSTFHPSEEYELFTKKDDQLNEEAFVFSVSPAGVDHPGSHGGMAKSYFNTYRELYDDYYRVLGDIVAPIKEDNPLDVLIQQGSAVIIPQLADGMNKLGYQASVIPNEQGEGEFIRLAFQNGQLKAGKAKGIDKGEKNPAMTAQELMDELFVKDETSPDKVKISGLSVRNAVKRLETEGISPDEEFGRFCNMLIDRVKQNHNELAQGGTTHITNAVELFLADVGRSPRLPWEIKEMAVQVLYQITYFAKYEGIMKGEEFGQFQAMLNVGPLKEFMEVLIPQAAAMVNNFSAPEEVDRLIDTLVAKLTFENKTREITQEGQTREVSTTGIAIQMAAEGLLVEYMSENSKDIYRPYILFTTLFKILQSPTFHDNDFNMVIPAVMGLWIDGRAKHDPSEIITPRELFNRVRAFSKSTMDFSILDPLDPEHLQDNELARWLKEGHVMSADEEFQVELLDTYLKNYSKVYPLGFMRTVRIIRCVINYPHQNITEERDAGAPIEFPLGNTNVMTLNKNYLRLFIKEVAANPAVIYKAIGDDVGQFLPFAIQLARNISISSSHVAVKARAKATMPFQEAILFDELVSWINLRGANETFMVTDEVARALGMDLNKARSMLPQLEGVSVIRDFKEGEASLTEDFVHENSLSNNTIIYLRQQRMMGTAPAFILLRTDKKQMELNITSSTDEVQDHISVPEVPIVFRSSEASQNQLKKYKGPQDVIIDGDFHSPEQFGTQLNGKIVDLVGLNKETTAALDLTVRALALNAFQGKNKLFSTVHIKISRLQDADRPGASIFKVLMIQGSSRIRDWLNLWLTNTQLTLDQIRDERMDLRMNLTNNEGWGLRLFARLAHRTPAVLIYERVKEDPFHPIFTSLTVLVPQDTNDSAMKTVVRSLNSFSGEEKRHVIEDILALDRQIMIGGKVLSKADPETLKKIFEEDSDPNKAVSQVAFVDGKVEGLALAFLQNKITRPGRQVFIYRLVVSKDKQGNKIGRQLLFAIAARAKALRIEEVGLSVRENNIQAKNMYAHYGFEIEQTFNGVDPEGNVFTTHFMVVPIDVLLRSTAPTSGLAGATENGEGGPTQRDTAMGTRGGIDLTPGNMNLQTKVMDSRLRGNDSSGEGNDRGMLGQNDEGIKFHLDAAMLQRLQNSPGFVPVIINVQPLKSLTKFLEIASSMEDSQA